MTLSTGVDLPTGVGLPTDVETTCARLERDEFVLVLNGENNKHFKKGDKYVIFTFNPDLSGRSLTATYGENTPAICNIKQGPSKSIRFIGTFDDGYLEDTGKVTRKLFSEFYSAMVFFSEKLLCFPETK